MSRYSRQLSRAHARGESVGIILAPRESLTLIVGAWLFRKAWRYRSELAPFSTALVFMTAATWLHLSFPAWWPLVLAVTALIMIAVMLAPEKWAKWWPPLGRRIEKAYVAFVTGYAGGWLSAATMLGPLAPGLTLIWMVGAIILGLPWWAHHRRRAKVRMRRTMEAWPVTARKCGIEGAELTSTDIDEYGWKGRIVLGAGQTVADLFGIIPRLESSLRTAPGRVRIKPDPGNAGQATIRVLERDPHAEPIPFPDEPEFATITEPHMIGLFEDGEPVNILFNARHILIGGLTGGGKSGLVNDILAWLVRCRDAAIWGIDLKGGLELGPWEPCLQRPLATDNATAEQLLADARAEIDRRTVVLGAQGKRQWTPTPDAPALVVLIDEYAELSQEARDIVDSIVRLGRALCVSVIASTQRPTQKVMGDGAVRSQMDTRICTRVAEAGQVNLILTQGSYSAGWRADLLDAPGKFLVRSPDPDHQQPNRARGCLLTDTDVERIVAHYRDHRPTLPAPGTASEARTGTNRGWSTQSLPNGGPVVQRPPQPVRDAPETILLRALATAPPDGITVNDLTTATGMKKSWVYNRLQEWSDTGKAAQVGWGRWRATDPPPDNQTG